MSSYEALFQHTSDTIASFPTIDTPAFTNTEILGVAMVENEARLVKQVIKNWRWGDHWEA